MRNRPASTVRGVVFASLVGPCRKSRRYISASSAMPITKTTKPTAVAAANDRSTLSMMPPRDRRATYPPWLRRSCKVSPSVVA